MKSIFVVSALWLSWSTLLSANVDNPIIDFKTRFAIAPGDKILKWEADLNGDGRNEVFLCLKSDFDTDVQSRDVPGWSVYIAEASPGNGYFKSEGTEYEATQISVGDMPLIDTSTCCVAQITQINRRGIVTMRIENPRSGEPVATIYTYNIEGNHIKKTQLAQYQPGRPNAIFDQYLKNNVRTQVQLQEVTP